jgi:hypothetical protein
VVCEQQDAVANFHLVCKRPIVSLILWQRFLTNRQHIRDVGSEIEADVSSGKAFDRVPNGFLGFTRM